MWKNPYIHIGFNKCASSYLQKRIFPKLKTVEYFDRYDTQILKDIKDIRNKTFLELPETHYLLGLQGKRALISQEGFLDRQTPIMCEWRRGTIGILNLHRAYGENLKIIIVIRRQDRFIESMYRSRHLKFYSNPDNVFLDYPYKKDKNGIFHFESKECWYLSWIDYYYIIMELVYLFGKENVHVLVYEDLLSDQELFLQKISNIFEEEIPISNDELFSAENVSPKRGPEIGKYLNIANKISFGLFENLLPEKEVLISEEFSKGLIDIFSKSNQKLSDYFNLELNKYGYF